MYDRNYGSSDEKTSKPQQKSTGFTLVMTISMMVLFAMVAIGLLSLSTVSLRSSSQTVAMAEARANARLALMMAIGQLQTQMVPDRRPGNDQELAASGPIQSALDEFVEPKK